MLINLAKDSFEREYAVYSTILNNTGYTGSFLSEIRNIFNSALSSQEPYLNKKISSLGKDSVGNYITKMFYGLNEDMAMPKDNQENQEGKLEFVKAMAHFNVQTAFSGELSAKQIFINSLSEIFDDYNDELTELRQTARDMEREALQEAQGQRTQLTTALKGWVGTKSVGVAQKAIDEAIKKWAEKAKSNNGQEDKTTQKKGRASSKGKKVSNPMIDELESMEENLVENLMNRFEDALDGLFEGEEEKASILASLNIKVSDKQSALANADIGIKVINRYNSGKGTFIVGPVAILINSDKILNRINEKLQKKTDKNTLQQLKVLDAVEKEMNVSMSHYIEDIVERFDSIIYNYLDDKAKEYFVANVRQKIHQSIQQAIKTAPEITETFKTQGGLFRELRVIVENQNVVNNLLKEYEEKQSLIDSKVKNKDELEEGMKKLRGKISGHIATVQGAIGEIYGTVLVNIATGLDVSQEGMTTNLLNQQAHADEIFHNISLNNSSDGSNLQKPKLIDIGIQIKNYKDNSSNLYKEKRLLISDNRRWIATSLSSADQELSAFNYLFLTQGMTNITTAIGLTPAVLTTNEEFNQILSLRLANFMRYTDVFQTLADGPEGKDPIVKNNFYMYRFNIIPTSALFLQLLSEMKKEKSKNMFDINVDMKAFGIGENEELKTQYGEQGTTTVSANLFGESSFTYNGLKIDLISLIGQPIF